LNIRLAFDSENAEYLLSRFTTTVVYEVLLAVHAYQAEVQGIEGLAE